VALRPRIATNRHIRTTFRSMEFVIAVNPLSQDDLMIPAEEYFLSEGARKRVELIRVKDVMNTEISRIEET
jgi:hypothetical protein